MLDLQIIASGKPVTLFDLPAVLGRRHAAREIGDAIDTMIAFMDDLGGDPDLEGDLSDFESDDDAKGDPSWPEWHTRGRHKQQGEHEPIRDTKGWTALEDDEDGDADTGVEDHPLGFDPEEDMCLAGDDGCGRIVRHGNLHWGSQWEDDGA